MRIPTRPSWQIQQEQEDTTGCKQGEPPPGDGAGRDGRVVLHHLGCTGMWGSPAWRGRVASNIWRFLHTTLSHQRELGARGGAAACTRGDGPPPRQHGAGKTLQCPYAGLPSNKKNNEILPFGMTWMDPDGILLSDISQTETNTIWFHLRVEYKKETK